MKNLKKLSRNEMKVITGAVSTNTNLEEISDSNSCTQCKKCSYGSNMCVTMSTCEEASTILNNIC